LRVAQPKRKVYFSAPGFEDFMRAGSVREGEKNNPMSEAENDQMEKSHSADVIYREPWIHFPASKQYIP
jgi:hypothetical protein